VRELSAAAAQLADRLRDELTYSLRISALLEQSRFAEVPAGQIAD
jgi:hypothetical protein